MLLLVRECCVCCNFSNTSIGKDMLLHNARARFSTVILCISQIVNHTKCIMWSHTPSIMSIWCKSISSAMLQKSIFHHLHVVSRQAKIRRKNSVRRHDWRRVAGRYPGLHVSRHQEEERAVEKKGRTQLVW